MKLHLLVNCVALLYLTVYATVPSSVFINPVDLSYNAETDDFTLSRQVRYPVHARWYTEVIAETSGLNCNDNGVALYEDDTKTATFIAGRKLERCMSTPGPKYVSNTWQVLLFGFLPLRSVSMTKRIDSTRLL